MKEAGERRVEIAELISEKNPDINIGNNLKLDSELYLGNPLWIFFMWKMFWVTMVTHSVGMVTPPFVLFDQISGNSPRKTETENWGEDRVSSDDAIFFL